MRSQENGYQGNFMRKRSIHSFHNLDHTLHAQHSTSTTESLVLQNTRALNNLVYSLFESVFQELGIYSKYSTQLLQPRMQDKVNKFTRQLEIEFLKVFQTVISDIGSLERREVQSTHHLDSQSSTTQAHFANFIQRLREYIIQMQEGLFVEIQRSRAAHRAASHNLQRDEQTNNPKKNHNQEGFLSGTEDDSRSLTPSVSHLKLFVNKYGNNNNNNGNGSTVNNNRRGTINSQNTSQVTRKAAYANYNSNHAAKFESVCSLDSAIDFDRLQGLLQNKDKQIKDLEDRVHTREEAIQNLTTSYLKDVSHVKELMVLQRSHPNAPAEEFFDVRYFDESTVLDPTSMQLLNDRLRELKQVCDKKMASLSAKLKAAQTVIENLQKMIGSMKKREEPESLLKTALLTEKNKYLIWQYIQETVGNAYFFEIFEKPDHTYSIRYQEIDALISNSKATRRQYVAHKEMIDKQYCDFVSKVKNELEFLALDSMDRQREMEEMKEQHEKELAEAKKGVEEAIQARLREKEAHFNRTIELTTEQLCEQFATESSAAQSIQQLQKKFSFFKWHFLVKLKILQERLENNNKNSSEPNNISENLNALDKQFCSMKFISTKLNAEREKTLLKEVQERNNVLAFYVEELKNENKKVRGTFEKLQNLNRELWQQLRVKQLEVARRDQEGESAKSTVELILSHLNLESTVPADKFKDYILESGDRFWTFFDQQFHQEQSYIRMLLEYHLRGQVFQKMAFQARQVTRGTVTKIQDVSLKLVDAELEAIEAYSYTEDQGTASQQQDQQQKPPFCDGDSSDSSQSESSPECNGKKSRGIQTVISYQDSLQLGLMISRKTKNTVNLKKSPRNQNNGNPRPPRANAKEQLARRTTVKLKNSLNVQTRKKSLSSTRLSLQKPPTANALDADFENGDDYQDDENSEIRRFGLHAFAAHRTLPDDSAGEEGNSPWRVENSDIRTFISGDGILPSSLSEQYQRSVRNGGKKKSQGKFTQKNGGINQQDQQQKLRRTVEEEESENEYDQVQKHKGNRNRVFDRLFQDSKEKQRRVEMLKQEIEKMEGQTLEKVLNIFNLISNDENNHIKKTVKKEKNSTKHQLAATDDKKTLEETSLTTSDVPKRIGKQAVLAAQNGNKFHARNRFPPQKELKRSFTPSALLFQQYLSQLNGSTVHKVTLEGNFSEQRQSIHAQNITSSQQQVSQLKTEYSREEDTAEKKTLESLPTLHTPHNNINSNSSYFDNLAEKYKGNSNVQKMAPNLTKDLQRVGQAGANLEKLLYNSGGEYILKNDLQQTKRHARTISTNKDYLSGTVYSPSIAGFASKYLEATKKIESVAGGGVPGRGATGTAQKANNNSAQLGNSINQQRKNQFCGNILNSSFTGGVEVPQHGRTRNSHQSEEKIYSKTIRTPVNNLHTDK